MGKWMRMERRYPIKKDIRQSIKLDLFKPKTLVCAHGHRAAPKVIVQSNKQQGHLEIRLRMCQGVLEQGRSLQQI
jgi:hypothetical protein